MTRSYESVKEELKRTILAQGLLFGEGPSRNEIKKWVFDTKSFLLDARGLHLATELLLEKIRKYQCEAIGGLTMASHILASALCYQCRDDLKLEAFLIRRKRKEHGLLKLIEGPDIAGKRVIIIDDGLNAAGFAQQAIEEVEKIGCTVSALVVLVNFQNKDETEIKGQGYPLEHIFTLGEFGLDTRCNPTAQGLFELAWKYFPVNRSSHSAPKSSPLIIDEKIYLGSDQCKVLCIGADGKLIWQYDTDQHPEGVHSTPILVGRNIIITGYDGCVYALRKDTGALAWKSKVSSYIGASPNYDVDSNLILLGLENKTLKGTLAVMDANTGTLFWEFSTNNHVAARPVVSANLVIGGSNDGHVYALEKNTGKLVWKFQAKGEVKGRLTADNGHLYFASFDGHIYCLIAATGRLVWKRKLGAKLYSTPLIIGKNVIVGSHSGQVTSLNKHSGEIQWHFMTQGPVHSYPSYAEGMIFFGSYDQNVYAIDSNSGTLLWKYATQGIVNSSPTYSLGNLYVTSFDGNLYCFKHCNPNRSQFPHLIRNQESQDLKENTA